MPSVMLALVGLLLAADPADTQPATPPGKLYTYKHSAGQPRQLEVYFPANHNPAKSSVPAIILFHGGGWTGGTPAQFRTACQYFASRGLVAATASYQLANRNAAVKLPNGQSPKRICITDARSAIRWYKQHAAELGIDPRKIITGGGSAGGHIAVLATTTSGLDDPADPKEIDTSVIAYLLFNPAFTADDNKDPEVDALRQVKATFAPAIVFFGTDDKWKAGWDAVYEKLCTLGNTTTEVLLAEGRPHGFFNRDPWQTATLIAADQFLVRQGVLTGKPTLTPPSVTLTPAPRPASRPAG